MAGANQVIEIWRGWVTVLSDSNATFESAFVSGGKVIVERTWRGKHTRPMQSPNVSVLVRL